MPAPESTVGANATASYHSSDIAGMVIGPYKLLQLLGEGGMGTVWVAEQEQPVKRRVALKLVKAGMDSAQVLRRFEAERQALAMMDHTNIAKVFDAGTTTTGRPYFVMELVKGVPITKYCDEVHASIPDRLELFIQVCAAVQHAHQKGIIHRDIKPSNVLLTIQDGKPVPKVIDFGVAKALHSKLADKTVYTEIGQVVGTLEYMAPEQAELSALDIDTRADIYALGVLLYELLTGSTPITRQRMKSAAFAEILRVIKEEEPPKPSTRLSESKDSLASVASLRRTDPKHLSSELKGELDWVVLKALEKDRTRRYETANGLSRDLQRYLSNETVEARPPSTGYRLRKFVRRNRIQVITAGLVVFALIAGVIGTTLGLLEARRQADYARAQEAEAKKQEELARAEAVAKEQARAEEVVQRKRAVEFRDKALDALRATTGEDVEQLIGSRKELTANEKAYLEAIAKRWQVFARMEGTDEQSRAIQAEGHQRVADLWGKLGRVAEARPEYEAARDLRKALVDAFPAVATYRHELAATHTNLGLMLTHLGEREAASKEYASARDLQKALAATFPGVPTYRQHLAITHHNLGFLLAGLGERETARKEYVSARDLQKALVDVFPAVSEYRQQLASTHSSLGFLLAGLGEREAARQEHTLARNLLKALVDVFPAVPVYRYELAFTHTNIGVLQVELGENEAARIEFALARDLKKSLVDTFPSVSKYQQQLALSHHNLGVLLAKLGEREAARQEHTSARELRKALVDTFPAMPEYRKELAFTHNTLGELLASLGKRETARQEYTSALDLQKGLVNAFPAVPEYRRDLAGTHRNIGNLLAEFGERDATRQEYTSALDLQKGLVDAFPAVPGYRQELAKTHTSFGIMLYAWGEPEAARKEHASAHNLLKALADTFPTVPEYRRDLAATLTNLGNALASLGERNKARKEYTMARDLQKGLADAFPAVPAYRQHLATTHNNLGVLLLELGEREAAHKEYASARDLQKGLADAFPAVPAYRQELARSHHNLGFLLAGLGKREEACQEYTTARDLQKGLVDTFPAVPEYRQDLANTHTSLGLLLTGLGEREAARKEHTSARDLKKALAIAFPTVPKYQVELGGAYCNLAVLVRDDSQPMESLEWFQQAIRTLTPIYERDPRNVRAKQFLRNSYSNRARAHDQLRQYPEAVKDWSMTIQLSSTAEQPNLRVNRITSQLQAGQVAEAIAEVAELTKIPVANAHGSVRWNADQWYGFACVYAVASGKMADKKEEYAKRSLELLQQAVKAGYKDIAHINKDTGLDPLRGREDFKKLMPEWEKSAKSVEKK